MTALQNMQGSTLILVFLCLSISVFGILTCFINSGHFLLTTGINLWRRRYAKSTVRRMTLTQ